MLHGFRNDSDRTVRLVVAATPGVQAAEMFRHFDRCRTGRRASAGAGRDRRHRRAIRRVIRLTSNANLLPAIVGRRSVLKSIGVAASIALLAGPALAQSKLTVAAYGGVWDSHLREKCVPGLR